MTTITDVRVQTLTLPLREPFEISLGTQHEVANVLVAVETAGGTVGWGEGAPLTPVTGETQASTVSIAETAGEQLVGEPLADCRGTIRELREAFPGMASALLAVETALLDAYCRERGMPMAALAGGTPRPVETDYTVPIVEPDVARERAARAAEAGFDHLKIKTGTAPDADAERVRAVRAGAPDTALKVDANQGWTPKETIRFVEAIADAGIDLELVEQPVPASDVAGLASVSERIGVPVCADEALFASADALRLVRADAVDVFNVKLGKSGFLGALDIVAIARAADLELMIGQMLESSIATHAAAHLVAGTGAFSYVDLDGNLLLAEDVVDRERDPVHRIEGPGHGITHNI